MPDTYIVCIETIRVMFSQFVEIQLFPTILIVSQCSFLLHQIIEVKYSCPRAK